MRQDGAGDHRRRRLRQGQGGAQAADDAIARPRRPLFDGIKPVLRRQQVGDPGAAHRYADDAPGSAGGLDGVVGIDRLMGAVEGADAKMDDAGRHLGRREGRAPHRRRQGGQARQGQSGHDRNNSGSGCQPARIASSL
jgi:hypothetical protein